MSEQFMGKPDPQAQNTLLAQWLYGLLANKAQATTEGPLPVGEDVSFPGQGYHAAFYPQIPNFALALLRQSPNVITRYAPLFFHLLGCPVCHRAYLETYDALRTALADNTRPTTTTLRLSTTAGLATTSPKLLVFLCQLLIGQARTLLRQAHREHTDEDAWARTLIQQAMQISRYLMQGTLRQRALRDLVEVASLAQPAQPEVPPTPPMLSYSLLVGAGSGARGRSAIRRADMAARPNEQVSIDLRAGSLEGNITQENDTLILRLVDLAADLRGHSLIISVPLGTLLEPVRWRGGNPYAIRSTGPVASDGTLTTPLGSTDLHLNEPIDRNLVETLFKKLDVRAAEE